MAFLGTSDPDGWVICDGVQRTNGSDGKYNNLIAASIGTGTVNGNYTPPDYKGAFLRGASGTGTNIGPAVNVSQEESIKSHTHNLAQHWVYGTQQGGGREFLVAVSGGAIGTLFTSYSAGSTETRPYNFGVNWIIKL